MMMILVTAVMKAFFSSKDFVSFCKKRIKQVEILGSSMTRFGRMKTMRLATQIILGTVLHI